MYFVYSQATIAVLPSARWRMLCAFGGIHLVAMYLVASAALPGIRLDSWAVSRWPSMDLEDGLKAAGLWQPRPLVAMFPVLVTILLVGLASCS